jgi:hypothetical protein
MRPEFDFILYLKDLGGAFPDKKILYFSAFLDEDLPEISENHTRLRSAQDLIDLITEIS